MVPSPSADFHVIRAEKGRIAVEDYNVSSQGKAEKKGLRSEWLMQKQNLRHSVWVDSNLQNIWALGAENRVYCLRAGGRDQEVNDLLVPQIEGAFDSKHWRGFVRGNGEGKSMLCLFLTPLQNKAVGKLKFYQIKFDDEGYDPKVCTLSDVLQTSETYVNLPLFRSDRFDSMSNEWGVYNPTSPSPSHHLHFMKNPEEGTELDCNDNQFPSKKNIPVFDMMKRIKGKDTRRDPEHKATIVWNFERGFEVIETPSIEELDSIEIPGRNRIKVVERPKNKVGTKARFEFSNKASEFGDTKSIIGILPDGDNLPEPRFPRTMQELEFREDTKRKISNLEGQIEELWGMFRDHVQSHD